MTRPRTMTSTSIARRLMRFAVGALLLHALPTWAWNAAGHRLVAAIAWGQLAAPEQAAVAQWLRAHPDYPRWVQRGGRDDGGRTVFIEASTWADEIRHDARFYDAENDTPTPTLAGFPDMQRHRDWHYVNRPLDDANAKAGSGRIGEQIALLQKTLAAPASTRSQRAYALPWLIHLVADAHQPLHVGVRFAARGKPSGSRRVINPYARRKRHPTLHAYWDDLPGPSWLRGQKLTTAAQALTALYPSPPASAPRQWLDESWRIARASAYPPGNDDREIVISAEFQQAAAAIARQRIAAAGYRLAASLRALRLAQPISAAPRRSH
ncbi:MAG: S1/P1 nuclease [Propionivibrio sp.]